MNAPSAESRDYFVDCALTGKTLSDCLVIDAHGHLGSHYMLAYVDTTAESFIKVMDRVGIDRLCLSSYWAFCGYNPQGNNELIDVVRRFPDRFFGYMSVSVGYPENVLGELQRCYDAGLRAVKILARQ